MKNEMCSGQAGEATREMNIRLPQRLAERIETYAKQNNTVITQVVIEAIDLFLRKN